MSRRSQISLRLLQTLQQIEDADREDISCNTQILNHSHTSHTINSKPISNEFNNFDEEYNNNSQASPHDKLASSQLTKKSRTVLNFPPHVEYNYDNYEDELSVVTQQLKNIQETQDVVLAELRMDIEQLNCENLTLRLCNDKLTAENQHLQNIITDLSKTSKILREHLKVECSGEGHHFQHEDSKHSKHCNPDITSQLIHSNVLPVSHSSVRLMSPALQQGDDCSHNSVCSGSLNDIDTWSESASTATTTVPENSELTENKLPKQKKKQRKLDKEEKTRCFEFLRRKAKDVNQNE